MRWISLLALTCFLFAASCSVEADEFQKVSNSTADLTYTLDTNDFSLTGTKSYWTMECLPTSSIMFSSPNCSGSKFNGIFEQDIEFISVYALTGSVDVEYVLVNAPVATN